MFYNVFEIKILQLEKTEIFGFVYWPFCAAMWSSTVDHKEEGKSGTGTYTYFLCTAIIKTIECNA